MIYTDITIIIIIIITSKAHWWSVSTNHNKWANIVSYHHVAYYILIDHVTHITVHIQYILNILVLQIRNGHVHGFAVEGVIKVEDNEENENKEKSPILGNRLEIVKNIKNNTNIEWDIKYTVNEAGKHSFP